MRGLSAPRSNERAREAAGEECNLNLRQGSGPSVRVREVRGRNEVRRCDADAKYGLP